MVIEVTTDPLRIDKSHAEIGDVLEVFLAKSMPIKLMTVAERNGSGEHWQYMARSMVPADQDQVAQIVENSKLTSYNDHVVADATIIVYTESHLDIGKPIQCTVEATWHHTGLRQTPRLLLDTFECFGGPILRVSPINLFARA